MNGNEKNMSEVIVFRNSLTFGINQFFFVKQQYYQFENALTKQWHEQIKIPQVDGTRIRGNRPR